MSGILHREKIQNSDYIASLMESIYLNLNSNFH